MRRYNRSKLIRHSFGIVPLNSRRSFKDMTVDDFLGAKFMEDEDEVSIHNIRNWNDHSW